jgi:hypothetical protein
MVIIVPQFIVRTSVILDRGLLLFFYSSFWSVLFSYLSSIYFRMTRCCHVWTQNKTMFTNHNIRYGRDLRRMWLPVDFRSPPGDRTDAVFLLIADLWFGYMAVWEKHDYFPVYNSKCVWKVSLVKRSNTIYKRLVRQVHYNTRAFEVGTRDNSFPDVMAKQSEANPNSAYS